MRILSVFLVLFGLVAVASAVPVDKIAEENQIILQSLEKAIKVNNSTLAINKALSNDLFNAIQATEALEVKLADTQTALEETHQALSEEKATRLQTGRERDVFILLFSIIATIYLSQTIIKLLLLITPLQPYTAALTVATPIVVFIASFFGIRLLVQIIVKSVF